MKKKKLYIAGLVIVIIVAAAAIGKKELFNKYFSTIKLQYITSYLNNNYLYDVDEEKGMESIYSGFVSGAENNVTYYLNADELKSAQISEAGNYFGSGLGLMWSMDGQSFLVTDVYEGSPAQQAGIEKGDKITKINDTQVLMANRQTLAEAAFSSKQEKVRYTLIHEGEEREVELLPAEVRLTDLKSERLGDLQYIKVITVQEGTSERLQSLIDKSQSEGCKGILLDIRDLYTNNMDEISKIGDIFLEQGNAFKVEKKGNEMKSYAMTEGSYEGKLCLITNSGTKAAAEALVLALDEKAFRVGSDTGGVKYLRTLVSLPDDSGVSVASGIICDKYGNELAEEGIAPDERVYIGEEEKEELVETGTISLENDSFVKAAVKKLG